MTAYSKAGILAQLDAQLPSGSQLTAVELRAFINDFIDSVPFLSTDGTVTYTYADDGAAVGPTFLVIRDSASPAANDILGEFKWQGRDSGGAIQSYASIVSAIVDPTAATEDGQLAFATAYEGVLGEKFRLRGGLFRSSATGGDKGPGTINLDTNGYYVNGAIPYLNITYSSADQNLTWTDDGSAAGPNINLRRDSSSPAASDQLSNLRYQGRDSAGNYTTYASIVGQIVDPTDGSEDGRLVFNSVIAGSLAERFRLQHGFYNSAATGGDQGAGTINVSGGFYVNGANISATYVDVTELATTLADYPTATEVDDAITASLSIYPTTYMVANYDWQVNGRWTFMQGVEVQNVDAPANKERWLLRPDSSGNLAVRSVNDLLATTDRALFRESGGLTLNSDLYINRSQHPTVPSAQHGCIFFGDIADAAYIYWDDANFYTSKRLQPLNGIKFLPTQAPQGDVNNLDDYEIGSWTPVLQFSGSFPGATYTIQGGRYIKIGRHVTVWGSLGANPKTTGLGWAGSVAQIGGLPFLVENSTYFSGLKTYTYGWGGSRKEPAALVLPNTTYMQWYTIDNTYLYWDDILNGFQCYFIASYLSAT